MGLNSTETNIVKRLIERYGDRVTLGELLNNNGFRTPIEEVNFSLVGIYENAYELDGDSFHDEGTIADFFHYEFRSPLKTERDGIRLIDVLSNEQIEEFADYFLGDRDERCKIYTEAVQSREVTHEEIVEYLKTLYVDKSFDYNDTIVDF